jgi:hypothetical protein
MWLELLYKKKTKIENRKFRGSKFKKNIKMTKKRVNLFKEIIKNLLYYILSMWMKFFIFKK